MIVKSQSYNFYIKPTVTKTLLKALLKVLILRLKFNHSKNEIYNKNSLAQQLAYKMIIYCTISNSNK